MSPHHALREFGPKLSAYERKEIMEYPEVWFLGLDAKKVEGVLGASHNAGKVGVGAACKVGVGTACKVGV
jgi:dual specificity tyrosine-phosphorylation-regulated kinase 2/3/4